MKHLIFNSSIVAYASEENKTIVCNNGHTIFKPEETTTFGVSQFTDFKDTV